uniref:Predicted protein n=1 Tax=Hordeum vulgare subsp. vulgare TaxID=112509 RepID=F2E7Y4_HORVV|nr:predicted protein [Hordeum vulgare subsp. vulgare]
MIGLLSEFYMNTTYFNLFVFLMFASTFKVLTGLSLAIVLARFLSERSMMSSTPEPRSQGYNLVRWEFIQVICSSGNGVPWALEIPRVASVVSLRL